jgi:hypothetical protein
MKIQISNGILSLIIIVISSSVYAIANPDRFLGPRDIRGIKSTIDDYIKHDDTIFRYGNWYGSGWWGGSTDARLGNNPPVDSLDAIAQTHDFIYQLAEQQGKKYGIAEEKRIKSIADYMAVCVAKTLPENPNQWSKPPSDVDTAARYRDRMITGFSYETPAYQGVNVTGKELDWVTSPITNWQLKKSNQLDLIELKIQVSNLQKNWNNKNLMTPSSTPITTDEQLKNPPPGIQSVKQLPC